jgi:hypothetical protein
MKTLRSLFFGGIMAFTMLAIIAVPCFTLTGCTPNEQKTIATLTGTLTQAVTNVAQLEGNAALAAQLQRDGSAAQAAIAGWQNGSAVDDVIEALGILQDDLNLIPYANQYAPLIDLGIGTIQTLLSLIPASSVTPSVQAKLTAHRSRTVFLGHPAPKTNAEFVKEWNASATSHGLPTLSIDNHGHTKKWHPNSVWPGTN